MTKKIVFLILAIFFAGFVLGLGVVVSNQTNAIEQLHRDVAYLKLEVPDSVTSVSGSESDNTYTQWRSALDYNIEIFEKKICNLKPSNENTIICPSNLKDGDMVAGLRFVDDSTWGMHFKGVKRIEGEYSASPETGEEQMDWVCMKLGPEYIDQFPKIFSTEVTDFFIKVDGLCFINENADEARNLLKLGTGKVVVDIDDLILNSRPAGPTVSARLLRVVEYK